MSGIDWSGADVVLACQLLSATTLAVHLLVLRPRAAQQDLLLDARIVQDELDLAERLGHVSALNVETVAVQQLLRRVRQNPRSAALVLKRIPELARAARLGTGPTDVEYLAGALDRLSDAAQRYLRGAWPRAGALSATVTTTATTLWDVEEPQPDDPEAASRAEALYPTADQATADARDDLNDALPEALPAESDTGPSDENKDADSEERKRTDDVQTHDELPHDVEVDLGLDPDLDLDVDPDLDPELHEASGPGRHGLPVSAADGRFDREPDATADPGPESGLISLPQDPISSVTVASANPDLPDEPWTPAWVDLVQAETPRRNSGLGLADRHARPYRPARSSGHSSAHRTEPGDRSSVLPR